MSIRLIILFCFSFSAMAAEPNIFFSDLDSAPQQAFVTVYGKGFGNEPGKVMVGKQSAKILSWTEHAVEFQLLPGSGKGLKLISASALTSNTLPFNTRKGRIFFVSQNDGNDAFSGKSAARVSGSNGPWKSLAPVAKKVRPGDVVYIRSGHYTEVLKPGWKANFFIGDKGSGKPGLPIAMAGYPGEAPLIGLSGEAGANRVIFFKKGVHDWTIAKLRITGKGTGIGIKGDRFRVIGNEIFDMLSSYGSIGISGCNNCQILGNHVHHSGKPGNKLAHLIYYEGGVAANVNIAWNLLHDEQGGRCIQVYGHNDSDALSGLQIHNNIAYNCPYDAILVGRTDAKKKGWIEDAKIFNNIVLNSGFKGQSGAIRIDSQNVRALVYNNTLINNHSSIRLMRAKTTVVKDNLLILENDQKQHVRISQKHMGEMFIDHNHYVGGDGAPRQEKSPVKAQGVLAKNMLTGHIPKTPGGYAFGVPQSGKIKLIPLPAQQALFETNKAGFSFLRNP